MKTGIEIHFIVKKFLLFGLIKNVGKFTWALVCLHGDELHTVRNSEGSLPVDTPEKLVKLVLPSHYR